MVVVPALAFRFVCPHRSPYSSLRSFELNSGFSIQMTYDRPLCFPPRQSRRVQLTCRFLLIDFLLVLEQATNLERMQQEWLATIPPCKPCYTSLLCSGSSYLPEGSSQTEETPAREML